MRSWLLAGLVVVASPCFAGEQVREVPAFKSVTSKGAFKLDVEVGQPQSVVVTAEDILQTQVSTQVVGDELVISMPERPNYNTSKKIHIVIRTPALTRFQMEGAGSTDLKNLSGESFQLNYRGVGTLHAQGKVAQFTLNAEGVGSLNAEELDAHTVDVKLEGVGSVKVRATDTLRARVDGIGSLTYYGKPAHISKSVDGIGRIRAGE